MAAHRASPGRTRRRRRGRPGGPDDLLLRRVRRRRVEDGRRGHLLAQRLGRLLQQRGGGGHRRCGVGPERGLRRHGRGQHPGGRLRWRRRLQIDGRRPHLDPPGPGGDPSRRPHPRAPQRPGHRVRGRAGPRLRPEQGARRVSLARRGEELGAGAVPQRGRRRHRPVAGPRTTLEFSSPPFTRRGAPPGRWKAAGRTAASTARRTAATRGRTSRATPACPRARWAAWA